MSRASVIRWSGPAAMLGGGLWAGAAVVMASRPRGVPGGPYRETGDLTAAMFVSLLLMLVGLARAHIRQVEGSGRLARTALVLPYVGAALLILGTAGLAVGLDIPWEFVMLGLFAASIGTLLFGLAAFQARVLPPAAALLLVIGALALLRFNTEDWRALLAVPFGLAWFRLGHALPVGRGRGASRHRPVGHGTHPEATARAPAPPRHAGARRGRSGAPDQPSRLLSKVRGSKGEGSRGGWRCAPAPGRRAETLGFGDVAPPRAGEEGERMPKLGALALVAVLLGAIGGPAAPAGESVSCPC